MTTDSYRDPSVSPIFTYIKRGLGRCGRFPRRAQQLTGVELRESTTVAGRPLSMPMGWVTLLAEEIDREAALSGRVRH